jgi:uncharacterized protein YjgD (DUF1641 family)
MVDEVTKGPVGTKMMEMMDVPSFAKGLTPQMLIDLAKSKKIITPEQQADFKNRVGKDRTALAQFNEIVTEADEPRLAYKGQSPAQIEMLRAKNLMPATSINKTQRITLLKDTNTLLNEAASMDATKEVKEKTFIEAFRKKFGDFADNPVIRKIAKGALMILNGIPNAVDFIPMSALEEAMGMIDPEPREAAKGGMMNINDITRPVGYDVGGIVPKKKPEKELTYKQIVKMLKADKTSAKEPTGFYKYLADTYPVDPINKTIDELKALGVQLSKKGSK